MVTKAFSLEDGSLGTRSISTARERLYSDIDLTFTKKLTGDLYKKSDAAAVKQAVKNLLTTNRTEKPFEPYYGGNLYAMLFGLSTEFEEEDVADAIAIALQNYEPRVKLLDVKVSIIPDAYDAMVTVTFKILSTLEVVTIDVPIARLR